MTNLPKNPKPQYTDDKEEIIAKKSIKVNEKKILHELVRIIKKSRKIEDKFKLNRNEAIL